MRASSSLTARSSSGGGLADATRPAASTSPDQAWTECGFDDQGLGVAGDGGGDVAAGVGQVSRDGLRQVGDQRAVAGAQPGEVVRIPQPDVQQGQAGVGGRGERAGR